MDKAGKASAALLGKAYLRPGLLDRLNIPEPLSRVPVESLAMNLSVPILDILRRTGVTVAIAGGVIVAVSLIIPWVFRRREPAAGRANGPGTGPAA